MTGAPVPTSALPPARHDHHVALGQVASMAGGTILQIGLDDLTAARSVLADDRVRSLTVVERDVPTAVSALTAFTAEIAVGRVRIVVASWSSVARVLQGGVFDGVLLLDVGAAAERGGPVAWAAEVHRILAPGGLYSYVTDEDPARHAGALRAAGFADARPIPHVVRSGPEDRAITVPRARKGIGEMTIRFSASSGVHLQER